MFFIQKQSIIAAAVFCSFIGAGANTSTVVNVTHNNANNVGVSSKNSLHSSWPWLVAGGAASAYFINALGAAQRAEASGLGAALLDTENYARGAARLGEIATTLWTSGTGAISETGSFIYNRGHSVAAGSAALIALAMAYNAYTSGNRHKGGRFSKAIRWLNDRTKFSNALHKVRSWKDAILPAFALAAGGSFAQQLASSETWQEKCTVLSGSSNILLDSLRDMGMSVGCANYYSTDVRARLLYASLVLGLTASSARSVYDNLIVGTSQVLNSPLEGVGCNGRRHSRWPSLDLLVRASVDTMGALAWVPAALVLTNILYPQAA